MSKKKRLATRAKKLDEIEAFFFDMYNHWEMSERDWKKTKNFLNNCRNVPDRSDIEI